MAKYTADQDSAYDDILAAGIEATISRVDSTYDEVEEDETITSVYTEPTAVCTVPASSQMLKPYENRFIEDYTKGKNIFFLVAGKGLTFDPSPGDLLYFNDKVWEIEGSTKLSPDGITPIMYTIGVKPSNLSTLP